jgi:hypothetical protein
LLARYLRRFEEFHIHWHAHLQDIYSIARLAEFLDRARDKLRLNAGELRTLFVYVVMIADQLQEKRRVTRNAFRSHALYPDPLLSIDGRFPEWRIIKQRFYGIRAGLLTAHNRKIIEQPRQAAAHQLVITGFSYANNRPAFLSRLAAAGQNSGPRRIALAYGVEQFGSDLFGSLAASLRRALR